MGSRRSEDAKIWIIEGINFWYLIVHGGKFEYIYEEICDNIFEDEQISGTISAGTKTTSSMK